MSDNHQNLESKINKPSIQPVIFDLDDTLWPLFPLIHDVELALFNWLQMNAPKIVGKHSIKSMRSLRQQLIPIYARFEFDLWALRHAMLSDSTAPGWLQSIRQIVNVGIWRSCYYGCRSN